MDRGDTLSIEADILAAGQELFAAAAGRRPRLQRGINGRLLAQAMDDERLRGALFQFVDVMPQLAGSSAVAAHLRACLAEAGVSGFGGGLSVWLLRLVARPSLAWLVRRQMRGLARHFLAPETETGLAAVITDLARVPAQMTVDAVGEAVLTEAEADTYRARNLALLRMLPRLGATPHVSLKLSALTPRFDPLDVAGTRERVFARLAPIVEQAQRGIATLTVDMEQHDLKPLTLRLFLDMLEAWPGRWQPAIALQAYLPETAADVEQVIAAAQRHGRRIGVRLVKGAYWDQECAWAAQRNWPLPVFRRKADSDAAHERLTRRLLENADCLHPAIASHNPRNQAVALAWARRLGLGPGRWEAQMLYGMAEPLRDAVAAAGVTMRVYVPVGDPVIGIAYLIRRLLENTASSSILRHSTLDGGDFAALMQAPSVAGALLDAAGPVDAHEKTEVATKADTEAGTESKFSNLPLLDFARDDVQAAFRAALAQQRQALPLRRAPEGDAAGCSVVNGMHVSRNPAQPDEVLGETELCGPGQVDAALVAAGAAFPAWRDTPVEQRTRLLRRAADLMERERQSLAALEVLEAAKNWLEADADVAEAVDTLRYYAAEMEGLAGWQTTRRFPGEDNTTAYAPRGVAVVIAPWNFPLAILCGMTAAALAAGNCAIMKPALPGLLIARRFLDLLLRAGVPTDVCQLLPGDADTGAALVADARVHVVAFTGSRAVGLRILQAAHTPAPGQRHVKQMVCEMGGKNAIVVDDDADPDEAVAGILASAFGYAGQKCSACSRVILVGAAHDRLPARLAEAAAALAWGAPENPAYAHGPLITEAAQRKALDYIEIGRGEGRLLWQGRVPEEGWYVPPTIFAGIRSQHRIAREEIFGPVLALLSAPDFASAIDMAMDSDYALTGGVYSRFPEHLRLAREKYRVGNLYFNRRITGARVGIQPFGGVALSGTGVQAGGPDYLKQFLWSRSLSSNTMRHGFISG